MSSVMIIGHLLLEKKVLKKNLTIESLGGHLDHVTFTIYLNFRLPFTGRLFKISALLSQTGSEERNFENGRRRRTPGELETALSLIVIPHNKLTNE